MSVRLHVQPSSNSQTEGIDNSNSCLLLRFPHGMPRAICDPHCDDEIDFRLYAPSLSADPKKASHRILVGDCEKIQYNAINTGEESQKSNTHSYALALVTPSQRHAQLIPVPHIYNMTQRVKALTRSAHSQVDRVEDSYATRQRLLVDQFGSRKRKSQLASRAANAVQLTKETASIIKSTVKASELQHHIAPSQEQQLIHESKALILPIYNVDALQVEHIYDTQSILPSSLYKELNFSQVAKLSQLDFESDEFKSAMSERSCFFRRRVKRFADFEHLSNSTRAVYQALLCFTDALIAFRAMGGEKDKQRALIKNRKVCSSELIRERLLNLFTEQHASPDHAGRVDHVLTSQLADKLICYLLVSALICCNYKLDAADLDELSSDLQLTSTELTAYMREVGCSSASKSKAELRVPLTFGTFQKKRRAKK